MSWNALKSASGFFAAFHGKKLPSFDDLLFLPDRLLSMDDVIRASGRNHKSRLIAFTLMLKIAGVESDEIKEFIHQHRNGTNVDIESLLKEDLDHVGSRVAARY